MPMAVELEGGCRVVELKEGSPIERENMRMWPHFRALLSLTVIETHGDATFGNDREDEVLYDLAQSIGFYVPAASTLTLTGPRSLISVRTPATPSGRTPLTVRVEERPIEPTGDRWYRELIREEVTQFVGSIPPGRAPDHFHLYEEVICILQGSGVMWAGETSTPVGVGSCIYLPIRQRHCLENTGSGDLRLLGVFFPAGSPAARYAV